MADTILDLLWPLTTTTLPSGAVVLATVQQDSPEDIRRGLGLICEVRHGELEWDEELGIPDPLGQTDPEQAAALIEAELRAIEPRASRIAVTVTADEPGRRNIHLKVDAS